MRQSLHMVCFCVTFTLVVDCGVLDNPANGRIDVSQTSFGTTATYSCNSGFVLVGKATRTCQANGKWSGVAPTCSKSKS